VKQRILNADKAKFKWHSCLGAVRQYPTNVCIAEANQEPEGMAIPEHMEEDMKDWFKEK